MRNITLSNETERQVRMVAEYTGESFDFLVEKLLQKAVKDTQYRTQRNARVYAEKKAEAQRLKALEAKLKERGINIDEEL